MVAVYWPDTMDSGYGQGTVCKTDADIERECRDLLRLGYGDGKKTEIHIIKTTREVRVWKPEGAKA